MPFSPLDSETANLDPEDWEQYRALAHRIVDSLVDQMRDTSAGPVWQPVPDQVKTANGASLPLAPQPAGEIWQEIRETILPYRTGNTHPRFWGWVHGSGTPGGALAELIAASMNANLGGRDHAAIYVERRIIEWCKHLYGFPADASGLLISGTSMATMIALTVSRGWITEGRDRTAGVASHPKKLVGYTSSEAHSSVAKAFEMLGLGSHQLRKVEAGPDFAISAGRLRDAILADRAQGLEPFCVIGSAGTVNTGAIDDLAALRKICDEQRLWLHVDAAFGAAAILSKTHRPLLEGIDKADSLAFDFHKWFHVPYDAGCILIRDGALHSRTFGGKPVYLTSSERGLAGGDPWFCDFGPELSRGFRALKVWWTLKEQGLQRIGRKVADNCAQAAYLQQLVTAQPDMEMLAPVVLNIACFRACPEGIAGTDLDRLNNEIVTTLQEQGIAAPSTTRINGQTAIRVCITNHRTRHADLDILVAAVREQMQILSGDKNPANVPA